MKYVIRSDEGEQAEEFTLGDYCEAMRLDVSTLGLHINDPCADMPPYLALQLVNKWNRESEGDVYFLPEDPAWL